MLKSVTLAKAFDGFPRFSPPASASLAAPYRWRNRHSFAPVPRCRRLPARAHLWSTLHAVPAEELRDDAQRQHVLPPLLLPRRLRAGEPHRPALVHARDGPRLAAPARLPGAPARGDTHWPAVPLRSACRRNAGRLQHGSAGRPAGRLLRAEVPGVSRGDAAAPLSARPGAV